MVVVVVVGSVVVGVVASSVVSVSPTVEMGGRLMGGRLIPPALLFAVPTVEVGSGTTGVVGSVLGSGVVVVVVVKLDVVSGDVIVDGSAVVEGAFGTFVEVIRSRLGFLVGLKSGVVTSSDSCDSSDSTDSCDSSDSVDSS